MLIYFDWMKYNSNTSLKLLTNIRKTATKVLFIHIEAIFTWENVKINPFVTMSFPKSTVNTFFSSVTMECTILFNIYD